MPKYTIDYLYNEFSALAGMRKGNPAYANDSTYWDGGHCNWGGHHNLREDVQTIGRGFEKLESLDSSKILTELNKCTSSGEYEAKKQNYTRKIDELNSGLQVFLTVFVLWTFTLFKVKTMNGSLVPKNLNKIC